MIRLFVTYLFVFFALLFSVTACSTTETKTSEACFTHPSWKLVDCRN